MSRSSTTPIKIIGVSVLIGVSACCFTYCVEDCRILLMATAQTPPTDAKITEEVEDNGD